MEPNSSEIAIMIFNKICPPVVIRPLFEVNTKRIKNLNNTFAAEDYINVGQCPMHPI